MVSDDRRAVAILCSAASCSEASRSSVQGGGPLLYQWASDSTKKRCPRSPTRWARAPSSSTTAGQSAITSQLTHYECVAAKSLGVTVNPQYGEFDYKGFQVVPAPPTLAADPNPTPSATPVQLQPHC